MLAPSAIRARRVRAERLDGVVEVALGIAVRPEMHRQRSRAEIRKQIAAQLGQIARRQERVQELEHPALSRRLLEQVALAADAAHERHDDLLAQGIDRRVGDLGEVLLEITEKKLRLVREDGDRNVDAIDPTGSSPPPPSA